MTPVDKERMNAPNLPILLINRMNFTSNSWGNYYFQLILYLIMKMFMSNQHCDSAYVKICPNLNMHFRNFILSHEKLPNARHTSLFIITKLVTVLSSRLHSLLNLSSVVKFDHIQLGWVLVACSFSLHTQYYIPFPNLDRWSRDEKPTTNSEKIAWHRPSS